MKLDNAIIGKRVILFPLDVSDIDHFVQLHRDDKNGMMGKFCLREMTEEEAKKYILTLLATNQMLVWTGYTKEGRASKRLGYIYITDITPFSCAVVGIIDKEMLKGIGKVMRKGKYTFSEDALRTIISWCFNGAGFSRIRYSLLNDNLLSIRLAEKVGFLKEGLMRKSFKIGEDLHDVAIYAILKDEYKMPEGRTEDSKKD